jgi:hypothetical protein
VTILKTSASWSAGVPQNQLRRYALAGLRTVIAIEVGKLGKSQQAQIRVALKCKLPERVEAIHFIDGKLLCAVWLGNIAHNGLQRNHMSATAAPAILHDIIAPYLT